MLKNKEIKYWINIRKEIKKIYGSMINYIYIYITNNLLIALIMRNNELILRTVSKKEYRW